MDQDSAMPLGTENDPIVILDSSPGYYNAKLTDQLLRPESSEDFRWSD